MGYRHYFIKIEKEKINELENLTERKLKTLWYGLPKIEEEHKKKYTKYGRYDTYGISDYRLKNGKAYFSNFEDFAYTYLNQFNQGQGIHELGKLYWDNTEERISTYGKEPNYKDIKIKERITSDNCFIIGGKEMLEEYMKICKEKYVKYLNYLSNEKDDEKIENMDAWICDLKKALERNLKSKERKVKTRLFADKDTLFEYKLVNRKKVIKKLKEELKKAELRKSEYIKNCEKNKDKLIYDKLKEDLQTRKFRAEWLGSDWQYDTAHNKLKTLLDFNAIDFDKYYILLYAF